MSQQKKIKSDDARPSLKDLEFGKKASQMACEHLRAAAAGELNDSDPSLSYKLAALLKEHRMNHGILEVILD